MINEWCSHPPDQAQPGFHSRLLDRDSDTNVFSTLWELYLHEMLLGPGCVVGIEPGVGTRGKKPDFLVAYEGERFVIEAIWTAQRLGETESNPLPPGLTDAIDGVPSPNFFVSYKLDRAGPVMPTQRRLKAGLTRWLASLDPDQVIAEYERQVPLPWYIWQEADWRLTFEAIPRSPGKRGDPASRTIGVHPASTWLGDGPERVLGAVKRKGGKYGDLALPFIVAVGQADLFPKPEDTETALYGTLVEYAHASTPTFGRMPDGYWTATYDHRHGRVSGVLTVANPAPWTWTKDSPVLWRSPDPSSLSTPILPTWATAQLVDARRIPATGPSHLRHPRPD